MLFFFSFLTQRTAALPHQLSVSNSDLTSILLLLLLLASLAQLLGYLFVKIRQPRVVGEILAGIVLGPALLGRLRFASYSFPELSEHHAPILDFVYWMGLLLLMFMSGAETKQLFTREERREVAWLAAVGTGIPFVIGLACGPMLVGTAISGPRGNKLSLVIILAVGVAVTSVPVISKIFADLKILHTRFARLVLGVAVLEDIVLWAALAVATALAGTAALQPRHVAYHLLSTLGFFALGLTLLPRAVKRINKSRFNVFAQHSPIAYALAVLLAYCVIAGALGVNLVFAAFLAGFAVVHKKRRLFSEALDAIGKVSFAFFIPIYFAMVGLKLDLVRAFSWRMLLLFLVATCVIKLLSVALAGRLAGFRGLDLINLAFTTNARGGPGIVLASVAFNAGIINATFYTTLVLAAVLTSQFAGAWLEYVLRRGWPLLSSDRNEPQIATGDVTVTA
ncbi:MAG TPA: cation:proton antiporter [Terriglobales bacterium]|nr:cation:proton antiporter [Terriglobales bacterium]